MPLIRNQQVPGARGVGIVALADSDREPDGAPFDDAGAGHGVEALNELVAAGLGLRDWRERQQRDDREWFEHHRVGG